jgi:hypothetical protein
MAEPRSVAAKLGCKPGMTGWAYGRPDELADLLPFAAGAHPADADVVIGFVGSVADVAAALAAVLPAYRRGKALWFAYPKKTGRLASDISRDKGWEPLAAAGLLPVSQVAIDDDWSALRFRYRDEVKTLTRKTDFPGA